MLDIRTIREDPELVVQRLGIRGMDGVAGLLDRIKTIDGERREAITTANELRARRNEVSKQIGTLKREGGDADALIEEMREVGDRIDVLEARVHEIEAEITEALMGTPNLPLDEVEPGDEGEGQLLRTWGDPASFDFDPKPHWELGEELGILDLSRGAKVSGSGFPVLSGLGARLQRTLINHMIDKHVRDQDYQEVRVPYLVTRETLTGTGQLPKFSEESYHSERDDLWLIPTAEVPVTNLHRDEILTADDLPLAYVAYSPCFRREAGAAGKDTRGLLRVHQFDKVELVRYESPSNSRAALEELTAQACSVLEELGLHHRVIRLPGGDLGFSAALTLDIEVWAPGVDRWLEVSSCSTFTDFQARRANLRFRPDAGAKPEFVHTLNGSALALPRLMVALLETYQQADGSVRVPDALVSQFGQETITAAAPPGA